MRNLSIIGMTLASATPAKTEEITDRATRGRMMNGSSVAPTSRRIDRIDQSFMRPKKPNKCLTVRYFEVQRLREQVLEAEYKENPR